MTAAAAASVLQPRDVDAALAELARRDGPVQLLAGGTDLLVEWASGRSVPNCVVDLSRCAELRRIDRDQRGLTIGAGCTLATLLHDPRIAAGAPLLAAVAAQFAAPQIRNRATIGGNLGTASPAGDLAPALLALGASVQLRSLQGGRDVPIDAFFRGYRRHAGRPGELIVAVIVPPRPAGERCVFEKVGTRGAQAIAKVAVAVTAVVERGVVQTLRAGAGAVADRPVRLPSVEALVGRRLDAASIAAAAAAAATRDCAPIDDVRSTQRYRRHALQRLLVATMPSLAEAR